MKNTTYLLHGALGSAQSFKHVEPHLSGGFVSYDFIGHGERSDDDAPFDMHAFAKDLLSHIRLHATGPVDLFGYSMGGYVALIAAKMAPERIGKIITYGTKFDWNPESSAREVRKLDLKFLRLKAPSLLTSLQEHHGEHWEEVIGKTAALMAGLGEKPALNDDQFQSIQHPVQLLRGESDKMVSREETEHIHRLLTQSSYSEIPGLPHQIDLIDGEIFAKLILDHL